MTDSSIHELIAGCIGRVREKKPLVHHITNYVTANDCANITLALGASPVMADDRGEAAEITAISSALAINIGTLNERTISSMIESGKTANAEGIPAILDPVGVGASSMRNRTTETLLNSVKFDVIKGNVSEIFHICHGRSQTKGVDAGELESDASLERISGAAREAALRFGSVVAVTGPVDVIVGGDCVCTISNGTPEMGRVTGSGCMCASLIACFLGAGLASFEAAVSGVALMGVAGETAFTAAGARGTGSFRAGIIDEVSRMTDDDFMRKVGISCEKM